MRSVSAKRKSRGNATRAPANRRATVRAGERSATSDRRTRSHCGPISRMVGTIRSALSPRRPATRIAAVVVSGVALIAIWANGYLDRFAQSSSRKLSFMADAAGFGISTIQISGNRYTSPREIFNALGFAPGESIFGVDVQQARERLLRLQWVSDAEVFRRYPDVICVRILEKAPFALWNSGHEMYVVDRNGGRIALAERPQFAKLPLFLGDAPLGASEIVEAIGLHRAVSARVEAMQRVSGRRWNLILDNGVLVKLPEQGWARQLGVLDKLIVESGILERDIAEIDLRPRDTYVFVLRNASRRKVARGNRA